MIRDVHGRPALVHYLLVQCRVTVGSADKLVISVHQTGLAHELGIGADRTLYFW